MPPGNFVCAALPSLFTHIRMALEDNPKYANETHINKFLKNNVNKFLTSVGCVLRREKKISHKNFDRYVKRYLNKFNNSSFLKDCEIIVDSAGFQIQQGYLLKNDIYPFIDLYNDHFISKQYQKFTHAFNLDLAPGSSYCPFDSWEEMMKYNLYSYQKTKNLSQVIKDKMIYVHHFRTPKINHIYKELLFKHDMAEGYTNFATGGLVSFSKLGLAPPYVLYVIPLIHILHYNKSIGLKKFRFHVLGGADWKEIFAHVFLARHIKELFDIDVEITYDSSGIFQTLCMGRYVFAPLEDTKELYKMSLRATTLQNIWKNIKRTDELFYDLINKVVVPYGMKSINITDNPLYYGGTLENENHVVDPENGLMYSDSTLSRLTYMYSMLYILSLFRVVEEWCNEYVDDLYPKYLNKSLKESDFNNDIKNCLVKLNDGKRSNNVDIRTISIYNSLNLLNEYKQNPDKTLIKCDDIINQYMKKDECQKLVDNHNKYIDYI